MHITVTNSVFHDQFRACGRTANFSHGALDILFNYLDEYDDLELDVIGICCDYSEESADKVIASYRLTVEEGHDPKEVVREYLEYHTALIGETPSGFVYLNF